MCVCVCVCQCERLCQREREREGRGFEKGRNNRRKNIEKNRAMKGDITLVSDNVSSACLLRFLMQRTK